MWTPPLELIDVFCLLFYVMSTGPRSFSWLRPLSLTRKRKISMSCKKQFAKKIYIYKFWFCDRNVDLLMLATKASTRCRVRPLKAEGIWGPVQASGGRQMPPVCYLRNGRVISFIPSQGPWISHSQTLHIIDLEILKKDMPISI